jgi:hypothetical protein
VPVLDASAAIGWFASKHNAADAALIRVITRCRGFFCISNPQ